MSNRGKATGGIAENEKEAGVDTPVSLSQHRAMLGEPENKFSLTRATLNARGAQKQMPISIASLRADQHRLADLLHNEKNGRD